MNKLKYYIINDLPTDFGEPELIAGFQNRRMAKDFLNRIQGWYSDSFSTQYYKLVPKKSLKKYELYAAPTK